MLRVRLALTGLSVIVLVVAGVTHHLSAQLLAKAPHTEAIANRLLSVEPSQELNIKTSHVLSTSREAREKWAGAVQSGMRLLIVVTLTLLLVGWTPSKPRKRPEQQDASGDSKC